MGFKSDYRMGGDPLKIVRLNKEGRAVAIPTTVVSEIDSFTGIVQMFVGLGPDNRLTIIKRSEILPIEEEAAFAEWEGLPIIGMLGQFPGPDNPGDGTNA